MSKTLITRRQLVGSAGAACLAGLAGRGAQAQSLTKVRYLTPFGYILGFSETLYGATGGFFAKQGLDVEVLGGRGSAMSVQQVTAGNVLLSRTGGTDLIKAYAKDPSIVAIAEVYQRDIFHVISQADKPIRSPEDMAGKTIGIVSSGGATENLLDMMLTARGVPHDAVTRQTVGNAASAFEFVKLGRVNAFIATNDTVFELKRDKQPVFSWSTDEVARAPGQVYMTSKATAERNAEELAKFLRGAHAAIGSMLAQKDKLEPVIASMLTRFELAETKRPDKGVAILRNALDHTFEAPYNDRFASKPAVWDGACDLMVKAKIIPEPRDRAFYDDKVRKLAFA